MQLEEKKVLLAGRFNPFRSAETKEWWYTGVSDRKNGVYFGFSVIRLMMLDSITVSIFDPASGKPIQHIWKGFTDSARPDGQLSLKAKGKNFSFSYTGSAETGWVAEIDSPEISARLEIKPRIPSFTKDDDNFRQRYTLLHFFQNVVNGEIRAGGKTLKVENALAYYDHCFGKVPRESKWHWIALQSERCAIASLVNYGEFAQRYTQAYFAGNVPTKAADRWIRLDQNVSFEYPASGAANPGADSDIDDSAARFGVPWRVTSPDMNLELEFIMRSAEKERIPPLIPFIIKIDHVQCFVRARGSIRVDGSWVETGDLYGVFEEHHGVW
jgi:hypothetical protein